MDTKPELTPEVSYNTENTKNPIDVSNGSALEKRILSTWNRDNLGKDNKRNVERVACSLVAAAFAGSFIEINPKHDGDNLHSSTPHAIESFATPPVYSTPDVPFAIQTSQPANEHITHQLEPEQTNIKDEYNPHSQMNYQRENLSMEHTSDTTFHPLTQVEETSVETRDENTSAHQQTENENSGEDPDEKSVLAFLQKTQVPQTQDQSGAEKGNHDQISTGQLPENSDNLDTANPLNEAIEADQIVQKSSRGGYGKVVKGFNKLKNLIKI